MINRFRKTCCYCYHSVEYKLHICSCDISVCDKHFKMHSDKFKCEIFCTVQIDKNEDELKVIVSGLENAKEITKKIKFFIENGITGDEKNGKVCDHLTDKQIEKVICNNDNICEICKIHGNLWVCIECGHIGCGREQAGTNGQGHAKMHYEMNSPNCKQCVFLTSIGSGSNQIFCYECNDYIVNKIDLKIIRDNKNSKYNLMKNNNKNLENLENKKLENKEKINYVGIINKGETCYISAVLQLLSTAFLKNDLTIHFKNCYENPIDCFCCQFVKIMVELSKFEMKQIDISDFLRILFIKTPEFIQGKQEDCAELLESISLNLYLYEFQSIFPKVRSLFSFDLQTITHCTDCGEKNERILNESTLYVELKESICKSLVDYFEGYIIDCKCGTRPNISYKVIRWPQRLVIVLKRYKLCNGIICKINNLIDVGDFLTSNLFLGNNDEKIYKFIGCVCHEGKNIEFGHYTWWTIKDGEYFLFDDDKITHSSFEKAKEGVMFLFELVN